MLGFRTKCFRSFGKKLPAGSWKLYSMSTGESLQENCFSFQKSFYLLKLFSYFEKRNFRNLGDKVLAVLWKMHFIVERKIVPKLFFGKFFGVFQFFSRSLSRNFTEISKLDHKSRWLWQNLFSRVRRKPGRKVFLDKTVSQLFSDFEEQKVAISRRKSLGPALTVLKTIFQVLRESHFVKLTF